MTMKEYKEFLNNARTTGNVPTLASFPDKVTFDNGRSISLSHEDKTLMRYELLNELLKKGK